VAANKKKKIPELCGPSECTGCGACVAVCPVSCISFRDDTEGFWQPCLNVKECTGCGRCSTVCPVVHSAASVFAVIGKIIEGKSQSPLPEFYASWNLDKTVRRLSSSGGVFSVFAEMVVDDGGLVFGAIFDDDFVVRHASADCRSDLLKQRGSKYVQSYISRSSYREIAGALAEGRQVLFSGTPCQTAGVRFCLGRDYQNLLCIDLICHGVPSPRLFKKYLCYSIQRNGEIESIAFRDKLRGWKKFCIAHKYKKGSLQHFDQMDDPYMAGFLKNYTLRRCCYKCIFANCQRFGDITLADFWGIGGTHPEYDREDLGTSLLIVNSLKGRAALEAVEKKLFTAVVERETALKSNSLFSHPIGTVPLERDTFYKDMNLLTFAKLVQKYRIALPSLPRQGFRKVLRFCGGVWQKFKNRVKLILRELGLYG